MAAGGQAGWSASLGVAVWAMCVCVMSACGARGKDPVAGFSHSYRLITHIQAVTVTHSHSLPFCTFGWLCSFSHTATTLLAAWHAVSHVCVPYLRTTLCAALCCAVRWLALRGLCMRVCVCVSTCAAVFSHRVCQQPQTAPGMTAGRHDSRQTCTSERKLLQGTPIAGAPN